MKAHKKAEKKKESVTQRVIITRTKRNKRKFITSVSGLETLDIKLKDASKYFGKKFACGSAVASKADGSKEIILQGDLSYDVAEAMNEKFDVPAEVMFTVEKGKKPKRVVLY